MGASSARQVDHRPARGSARWVSARSDGACPPPCSGSRAWPCSTCSRSTSGVRSGGRGSRRCCWRSTASTSCRAAWRCSTSSSPRSSRRRLLFLVLDRERMGASRSTDQMAPDRSGVRLTVPSVGRRLPRVAVATKWSGAFALPFAAGLCGIWAFTGGRRDGRSATATIGTLAASFVLVPAVVYLVSYGAFFIQHGFAVHDFVTLQIAMLQLSAGARRDPARELSALDLAAPAAPGPLPARRARWFVERRDRAREPGVVVGVPAVAARRARPDRSTADVAGRGRLRRIRRDVPPVVRGRTDAVHLVHAAGRPVHVPRRVATTSVGCRHERREGSSAIVFTGATAPRRRAVPPGLDRAGGSRTPGSTRSGGCPAGRCEREREEGGPEGPPFARATSRADGLRSSVAAAAEYASAHARARGVP